MDEPVQEFSLGVSDQQFWPGIHICQIFNADEERLRTIFKFMEGAIASRERAACFSDRVTNEQFDQHFASGGLSWQELTGRQVFTLSGTSEVYFSGNVFDPDRMIAQLRSYYTAAVSQGYASARVIGEMIPEVQHVPGGERLREYESKVSILQRECPVTTICQYDAHQFNGAVIMDIMKVHPYLLVNGKVIQNPVYIRPEEYLATG